MFSRINLELCLCPNLCREDYLMGVDKPFPIFDWERFYMGNLELCLCPNLCREDYLMGVDKPFPIFDWERFYMGNLELCLCPNLCREDYLMGVDKPFPIFDWERFYMGNLELCLCPNLCREDYLMGVDKPFPIFDWERFYMGKRSCGITKQGSKYLRTVLVEIAHVVARMGNSRLSRFFQKLKGRKNYNVAITALARKLICLIYHLLINQELYQEDDCEKREPKPESCDHASSYSPKERLEDKVAAIVDAFYHLNARDRKDVLKDKSGALPVPEFVQRRLFDGGG